MRRIVVLLLAATAGCASKKVVVTPEGGSTTAVTAPAAGSAASRARSADVISEAEIAATTGVTNAFDLVRRLRPNFMRNTERTSMRTNSPSPLVRVNGQILGEVAELRTIEIGVIQEIRYYSIVEAESRFSGDRGRPVIAVTTKKLMK
ncbi:MAG: hypothetical protein ACT4P7_04765 [Gemmatimonadaceae bacterium]